MPQPTAGQRARRQTAPSGPPKEFKVQMSEIAEVLPEGIESITDVKNELDFVQWYSEIENDLLESSYDEYQSCLQELQTSKSHLDALLSDTSSTLDLLRSLSESFKAVEAQTSNFRKQCEGILSAQKRDTELAEKIQENIQYYEFLDPASRRLNAPGAGNAVRSQDFSDMLRRLDECLDYMETHPEQKEAIRKKLYDIAHAPSTSKDLVAFARASISYVRGVCLDEFELWGEWFHGQAGLYDFLETICEPLYDHLRPRIIHEDKIVNLCQLCTLLQTRFLLDQDEEVEQTDANQLDFFVLIQPALEDVQTRLVFRAQAFLRDEIERFKPRPEDLDYPARNKGVSITVTENQISGKKVAPANTLAHLAKTTRQSDSDPNAISEQDSKWDFEVQAALSGWYPTLRKAIWLLSRIYRLVNSTVFDDLAHQIVHQTTLSLHQASAQISSKSTADGKLFLMSHLLILKQQIVAFDIEYVAPEVSFDFSGITNTFWELRERGGLFNPRNLMRLVGHGLLPRVVENMLDAKVELDGRLRTVINDFINEFATKMTASLPAKFIDRRNLQQGELIYPTCQNIEKEVPNLRKILGDYLDDPRMKETLVGAVQDRVIQIYEDFFDRYTSSERSKGHSVSKKGKGREDAVWDVGSFAEWCENIFRVGIPEQDDEGLPSGSLSRSGSPGS
ncbi:hypothetical protein KXX52_008767 [Aspergillus fumigatus]|nr:hypothetical protein KXX52_008767 [Aspergillus fumigatus]